MAVKRLQGKSQRTKLMKMIDALEDLDDVQNVYGNYEISEAVMEKLGA